MEVASQGAPVKLAGTTMNGPADRRAVRRMVAVTLLMKREHQIAGFAVARDFARQVGLPDMYVDNVEVQFRLDGAPLKWPGRVDAFHLVDRELG